ncbi:MAG: VCBS repeat-containing protein, partial [Bryobacteraceae bacterium]
MSHRSARQGGNESPQQATQTLPAQVEIPFMVGLSIQPTPTSAAIFFRETDGTYISLQFGLTSPYSVLSPTSEAAQWFSGGLKSLVDAPAGPSGTGLQSQVCSISELDSDGSEVIACAGNNSVGVSSASVAGVAMMNYPVGQSVNSVFFADFNGDGNADLAVAYDGNDGNDGGGIAILLNKGDGTFGSPVTYASGTPATNFAVLDLNHDGFLDIATVSLDQKVTVLLGNGDGTFGVAKAYAVGGGSGQAIAIADFNGDGNPDIVVGGTTGILLGNGDGTFRAGSPLPAVASGTLIWAFAAGDLNGDGKIDLVYADIQNQVVAPLFGNGDGTFQPGQAYAVSQLPSSLVLADYNNDGRLDIINASGDARIFGPAPNSNNTDILLNNGDGTFQGVPTYFTLPNSEANGSFTGLSGLAVANFGGAYPGVLASAGGGLTLFIGNGKGGFQAPQSVTIQGDAGGIATADFNGDGKPDAAVIDPAVITGSANVAILLGTASGFATPVNILSGVVYPTAIVSGDFSGDGNADLAVVGQTNGTAPGTLAILKGDGHGNFQAPVTIPAGVTPTAI